jgi:Protein of unknown function (DUF1761)
LLLADESLYRHRFGREHGMRVKWAAILVAAVADWLLGAVWFTVFANQWRAGIRMPADQMQANIAHPNFWPFLIAFGCSLVMAYAIARVIAAAETHSLVRGIVAGILVGLAAAAAMATEMVFEIRPGSFLLIAAGYPLLGSILMGIILGAWKQRGGAVMNRPASTK